MDLYAHTSYELARRLTARYSTSFSLSSRLFDSSIRPHIYAIYGLVRIADEIVDTYADSDARERLEMLQQEVNLAVKTGYSTNPIVHCFALTAQQFHITNELWDPFFDSMRMDLVPQVYSKKSYLQYIYGSAEVVGLMCLRVMLGTQQERYNELAPGARALGSAYQKVNFLRDIEADHLRGRMYFPDLAYAEFDNAEKQLITDDIHADFAKAQVAIRQLPMNGRRAVAASFLIYKDLLRQLEATSTMEIKESRIRVSNPRKVWYAVQAIMRKGNI